MVVLRFGQWPKNEQIIPFPVIFVMFHLRSEFDIFVQVNSLTRPLSRLFFLLYAILTKSIWARSMQAEYNITFSFYYFKAQMFSQIRGSIAMCSAYDRNTGRGKGTIVKVIFQILSDYMIIFYLSLGIKEL